jgi:3',5'-cyclic-AMP phosphodiesterase
MNRTIAYITDLHLDEEATFERGVNPRLNFNRVLEDIAARGIEDVVIGGDIGESSAFRSFFDSLKNYRLRITPGNHDRIELISGFFERDLPPGKSEWYDAEEDDRYKYIFLDSSSGELHSGQLQWLRQQLITPKEPVIFIHHPVLPVDTAMDRKYPLIGRETTGEILQHAGKPLTIFSGHYHMDDAQTLGNITQYITPAVSFQIRRGTEVAFDTSFFGYRLVTFNETGVTTELVHFKTKAENTVSDIPG